MLKVAGFTCACMFRELSAGHCGAFQGESDKESGRALLLGGMEARGGV